MLADESFIKTALLSIIMVNLFGRQDKAKVFFDTNFLMLLGSQGLDIFTAVSDLLEEPYELCVLDATLRELRNIFEGKTKAKGADKFNAKLGYILAKQKGLKTVRSSTAHVDDALVTVANENTYVATLDKTLQGRLKEQGATIIYVKGKNQLAKA